MNRRKIIFLNPHGFAPFVRTFFERLAEPERLDLEVSDPRDAPETFEEAVHLIRQLFESGEKIVLISPYNQLSKVFRTYEAEHPGSSPVDMLTDLKKTLGNARNFPSLMPFQEQAVGALALEEELRASSHSRGILALASKFLLGLDKSIDMQKLKYVLQRHLRSGELDQASVLDPDLLR